MFRCGRLCSGQNKTRLAGTDGNITFRKRINEQEYFFYVNAACQAVLFFSGKVRFVLAYIFSLVTWAANNGTAMVMKKLKGKLSC